MSRLQQIAGQLGRAIRRVSGGSEAGASPFVSPARLAASEAALEGGAGLAAGERVTNDAGDLLFYLDISELDGADVLSE